MSNETGISTKARELIHSIKVYHGQIHLWLLGIKIYIHGMNKCKENKVVATAFHGKLYGDNPKYIVEMIHDMSPQTSIRWLRTKEAIDSFPAYVQVIDINDESAVIHELASASIIVGNSGCFSHLIRESKQLHIETWHGGLGFKKIGRDAGSVSWKTSYRSKHAYDFFLSNSDHLTKLYRSAFLYQGPVWKCGYPIEDELQIDCRERQLCHERYHLSHETKILLYAPTFRTKQKGKSKLNASRIVETFGKRFGGKWVVLVHWHPAMRQEERQLDDAIDATDTVSMQSLVKAADACISDYSSSIFQAVQCSIPCFVYADDYDGYNMERGLYYPLDEQPFPYALTEEALINNILHYDVDLWKEKWKQYQVRMGHIVTGHSAEDIAKVCVDFLNGKLKSDIMKEIPFETRF